MNSFLQGEVVAHNENTQRDTTEMGEDLNYTM